MTNKMRRNSAVLDTHHMSLDEADAMRKLMAMLPDRYMHNAPQEDLDIFVIKCVSEYIQHLADLVEKNESKNESKQ